MICPYLLLLSFSLSFISSFSLLLLDRDHYRQRNQMNGTRVRFEKPKKAKKKKAKPAKKAKKGKKGKKAKKARTAKTAKPR